MDTSIIPKLSAIHIENLRLRAYIGFMNWETEKLQDVVISYSFKYDVSEAVQSDNIKNAVNYKNLNKEIITNIEKKRFSLIESIAENIFQLIQNFSPKVQDVQVKVDKPHALRFTDNATVIISASDRFNTAIIALGSNIKADENFSKAMELIQQTGSIIQRSEFIVTSPVKFKDQPDFLNGAILLITKKNLYSLQIALKEIEAALGRVRTNNKNAPRTIDLDIVSFNGFIIEDNLSELPFLIDFVKQLQPELNM